MKGTIEVSPGAPVPVGERVALVTGVGMGAVGGVVDAGDGVGVVVGAGGGDGVGVEDGGEETAFGPGWKLAGRVMPYWAAHVAGSSPWREGRGD